MVVKPDDKKKIMISGSFVFALSFVVFLSIFLINRESSIFGKRIILMTKVANVNNLKIGGAVQLKGIKIGSVEDIQFESLESIVITLSILEEYKEWIKKDSIVAIQTQGVLGDKFVEISGGTESSANIVAGDLLNSRSYNQFDSFLNKGEDILIVSKRVLQKIDSFLDAIEPSRVNNVVINLEQTTTKLNQIMSPISGNQINNMIQNLTNASKGIKSASEMLSSVGGRIKEGPGTLHSLIYDRALHDDLKSILGGAKRSNVIKYFVRESIKQSKN